MAFGNEIKFKIGGDATALERTFERAAQKGVRAMDKVDRAAKKLSRPQMAIESLRANIEKQRERRLFNEANTVGKIKLISEELADYAHARAKSEKGSLQYLQAQAAIETRLTTLRGLQRQQQSENLRGTPSVAGSGASGGGMFGGLAGFLGGAIIGAAGFIGHRLVSMKESALSTLETQQGGMVQRRLSDIDTENAPGGVEGRIKAGEDRMKLFETLRNNAERTIKTLSSGPMAIYNKMFPERMEKAKADLEQINTQSHQQRNENTLTTRELLRQDKIYKSQVTTMNLMHSLQRRGRADPVSLAKLARGAAIERGHIEERYGTPESARAAWLQAGEAAGAELVQYQGMQQRQKEVREQLTGMAAQGRQFGNGQRRPRSETERLAEQAQRFRERMRGNVVTGASQGVADNLSAARDLEEKVAGRLSRATEQVPDNKAADLTAVPSLLQNSNMLLTAISNALRVQSVSASGMKSSGSAGASGTGTVKVSAPNQSNRVSPSVAMKPLGRK